MAYYIGKGLSRTFRTSTGILTFIGFVILLFYLILAIFAPFIAPYDPTVRVGRAMQPPSSKFLFGTDNLGRDILSRVIFGARIALSIAFLAVLIASLIGIPLGLIAGFLGGVLDRILTLIMDAIYSFPGLILAIAIAAVLGPGMVNIAISIAVVYAPTYYRVIRNQVASVKNELYVEAARAIGAKNWEILIKYVFPNVLPSIVVVLSMNLADAIMTEAGLSFLGLGIAPPTPDWGFDLKAGHPYLLSGYWWLITFPGLMIMILAVGFTFIGEGVAEYLGAREVKI